jgi:hypothetical protein
VESASPYAALGVQLVTFIGHCAECLDRSFDLVVSLVKHALLVSFADVFVVF